MPTRQALIIVLAMAIVQPRLSGQAAPPKRPSPPPSTLPGGASEIQETHGDWRVRCQQGKELTCVVVQQQADKDTRQLVLGVELKAVSAQKAEGTILLPFGLAVSQPVAVQIDETPATTLPFRTCVPVGCLVPVTFDGTRLSELKKGTVLTVKANAPDGVQETVFRISLSGISGALDRALALGK